MKVERPPARSSAAPMRVKMRSILPIRARDAGTKAAACAPAALSAPPAACTSTYRPWFGPVISSMRRAGVQAAAVGRKAFDGAAPPPGGGRPSMSMSACSEQFGGDPVVSARRARPGRPACPRVASQRAAESAAGARVRPARRATARTGHFRGPASGPARTARLSSQVLSSGVM